MPFYLSTLIAILLAAMIIAAGWLVGTWLRKPLVGFVQDLKRAAGTAGDRLPATDRQPTEDQPENIAPPESPVDAAIARWLADSTSIAPDGSRRRDGSAGLAIGDPLMERAVPTLRWLDVAPNMFVGAGLAITFTLLAFAISFAAPDGAAGGGLQEDALKQLLATAGIKFATSIAAILVSLALILDRTRLYAQADVAMQELAERLDALVPQREPEGLAELLNAGWRQAHAMETVATRMETALNGSEAALTRALSEAMTPMARAVAEMGQTVATTNSETMERMVGQFVRELGSATARHNEDLAEILKATTDALKTIPPEIAKSGQALVNHLADARDALGSLQNKGADAMSATADRLERLATATREVESRLADRVDIAEGNANAAAKRLGELAATLDVATPAISNAGQMSIEAANRIREVADAGNEAREKLDNGVRQWVSGMTDIDVRISNILKGLGKKIPPRPGDDVPQQAGNE